MIKIAGTNSFSNFILKLLAFFAVVFLLDFALGHLLKKFYFKQSSGFDYSTTYAIEKANPEILILGSSRAVNIFDTEPFAKHFNLSCYNAGRYGEPVFYHYALLKSILKRHSPKMIILSFDAGNFNNSREAYDRLTVLLPYYNEHPEIRSMVELRGPYEKLKLLSQVYPYNSLILPIITGNSSYGKQKYSSTTGFIPLKRTFSGSLQTFDYSKEKELDSNKINAYRSFIKDCINSKTELYIVCPPYMINSIGTDRSITEGKRIAEENNIGFFDYSRDSFFVDKPQLFADFRHLNETGVGIFSQKIIQDINSYRQHPLPPGSN